MGAFVGAPCFVCGRNPCQSPLVDFCKITDSEGDEILYALDSHGNDWVFYKLIAWIPADDGAPY